MNNLKVMNQKDISTWNTSDISSWLKSINMTQYIAKFELNKINGYDLIYLTKEDLKNLGITNIHDKNVILNSMKKALLNQLKFNVTYKNKSVIIQLDFDPNYTIEQLIQSLKLIFKPNNEIFLVVNNNEILMPNLKIIDLILYEPKTYKNFKIISDELNMNNNYNKIYPNKEDNNKRLLAKTPNKSYYKNYYNIDFDKENKNIGKNNNYSNSMVNIDNLENLYNKKKFGLDKNFLKNYNNNNNNNNNDINMDNTNEEYYSNYKTYSDFNKIKIFKKDELDNNNNINIERNVNNNINNNIDDNLNINYENKYIKEANINNNKLYEINNMNNLDKNNMFDYKKNYSIKNNQLNLEVNNIDINKIKNEEDDGQKYSSEKRNFRLKDLKLNRNYGNNLDENNMYLEKNNYNYDLNNVNEIKDERMNYTSGTSKFI